jgi:hypothetical protein
MDLRFGTWNVRNLCRSGSLETVARELGKYKLDLVGVQEDRRDKGGTEGAVVDMKLSMRSITVLTLMLLRFS